MNLLIFYPYMIYRATINHNYLGVDFWVPFVYGEIHDDYR